MTRAPSETNSSTAPLPMPEPPPVTMATLPSSLPMSLFLSFDGPITPDRGCRASWAWACLQVLAVEGERLLPGVPGGARVVLGLGVLVVEEGVLRAGVGDEFVGAAALLQFFFPTGDVRVH